MAAAEPPLSGYLAKKHRSEHRGIGCALRFFWVDDATGTLHYAQAANKKSSFSLSLADVTAVTPSECLEGERVSYLIERGISTVHNQTEAKHGFDIAAGADRGLTLYALSMEEARRWIQGLQARAGMQCGVSPPLTNGGGSSFQDAAVGLGKPGEAAAAGEPAADYIQGWLTKHHLHHILDPKARLFGNGRAAGWAKRYFRLDPTAGTLTYAANEHTLEARKSIHVSTVESVLWGAALAGSPFDEESEYKTPTPHCLQLVLSGGRELTACAANKDDLQMWAGALSRLVESYQAAASSNRRRLSSFSSRQSGCGDGTTPVQEEEPSQLASGPPRGCVSNCSSSRVRPPPPPGPRAHLRGSAPPPRARQPAWGSTRRTTAWWRPRRWCPCRAPRAHPSPRPRWCPSRAATPAAARASAPSLWTASSTAPWATCAAARDRTAGRRRPPPGQWRARVRARVRERKRESERTRRFGPLHRVCWTRRRPARCKGGGGAPGAASRPCASRPTRHEEAEQGRGAPRAARPPPRPPTPRWRRCSPPATTT